MDTKQIKADIDSALSRMSVKFSIVGGHLTKRDTWECFAWRAEFTRTGKREAMGADYFTGIGNVIKPKSQVFHGVPARPITPTAADVLYSLLLDAGAVDQSFIDWCAELGGDSDSIAAFKTYSLCCEIGQKMRAFFTAEERAQLATMLQDY
jgi:hypothetical protein